MEDLRERLRELISDEYHVALMELTLQTIFAITNRIKAEVDEIEDIATMEIVCEDAVDLLSSLMIAEGTLETIKKLIQILGDLLHGAMLIIAHDKDMRWLGYGEGGVQDNEGQG